jgi:hypothetical protein
VEAAVPPLASHARARASHARFCGTKTCDCFPSPTNNNSACTAAWGGSPRTVLMVADDGAFSGTPEDKVYIDNLSNKVSFPAGLVACPRAFFGTVMNQPVAVITSGIGPMAAALCTFDLMNEWCV